MKQSAKFITALLFCAAFALPAVAQVRVIPKVGVNFSGLDAKLDDITAEARVGWNAGLDFRIGEGFLYLNPGAHYYSYTARLVKDVQSPDDIKLREETTIQNLKLPVNLGIRLTGDNGLLGLHVQGGVVPTMVLGVTERQDFFFDKNDLNTFTLGANMGVGVDVLFFTLDANYEIGLNDFFKNAEGRNNMLTISAGIKF
ncbi:MAG: outer membrane beta-barrel protein [Phaeodactylibacter sp.]|nr:outer membrane beta-barrel protein [Phaeodactylibacter sp.]MCB9274584.1 outer membrane beta-barrel protein [Lewinellaceae bacterium]